MDSDAIAARVTAALLGELYVGARVRYMGRNRNYDQGTVIERTPTGWSVEWDGCTILIAYAD